MLGENDKLCNCESKFLEFFFTRCKLFESDKFVNFAFKKKEKKKKNNNNICRRISFDGEKKKKEEKKIKEVSCSFEECGRSKDKGGILFPEEESSYSNDVLLLETDVLETGSPP